MQAVYKQNSYIGGMNRELDATKIARDEFPLLVNGRCRFGLVEPIKQPLLSMDGIEGLVNLQGLYAANNLILVFADGKAYYRNLLLGLPFVQIANFQMDANVPLIYAEAVMASTMNYERKSTDGNASSKVVFASKVNGSPLAIVCQDGINQPWLILQDASARVTQNYNQWTTIEREYVPIGLDMFYGADGVLYIVSADRKRILRSISGRPLDFMIVVDANGNKLAEANGNADVVSHAIGYNPITGINPLPTSDGTFFASMQLSSTLVTPVRDVLYFDEPRFRNNPLAPTGVQNSFSLADVLGDTGFIDMEGLKTFNAVLQLNNEGKNSPFSAKINSLFKDILQSNTACAINFDDYAMFSMDTVFGPAVVIYDTIRQKFVGIDIYAGISKIKKFAVAKVGTIRKLFFATINNKIYEAFAGRNYETCQLYIGEFASEDAGIEQKVNSLALTLTDTFEDGTIYASLYEDSIKSDIILLENVTGTQAQQIAPLDIPVGQSSKDTVRNLLFLFKDFSKNCCKIGILLSWNFNAKIANALVSTEVLTTSQSTEQQAQVYQGVKRELALIKQFSPVNGVIGQQVTLIGSGFVGVTAIHMNDVAIPVFSINSNNQIKLSIPNGASTAKFRLTKNDNFTFSATEFVVNP